MNQTDQQEALTSGLISYIEEWKERPGNLIMVLHKIQEEYGYLPRAIAFEVARLLKIPLAKIYGVVTFYHFFKLEKPGQHNVQVCMGTACYLKGARGLVDELDKILGIGLNETSSNGKYSMESVRCVGCCGLAPVVLVDGEAHGNLEPDHLPEVIAQIGD